MASMTIRQVVNITTHVKFAPSVFNNSKSNTLFITKNNNNNSVHFLNLFADFSSKSCNRISVFTKASSSPDNDTEDGVSLGTMKLPSNTDVSRFETLLFQWGNSLCQGANLPLPMPLKVDKIPGGARLGFITIGDAETQVLVYIDCLVFPATDGDVPIFRAIRNGPLKDQPPPGEPRIMRSLLDALKKCVEIARI
ncbi:hypothetical protein ACJIZ3_023891 [Penstemon smallii]|uniref:DUF7148 domain-containing protein n=1 Tax=Penstemon smallii TaxID=265156 RepID=A0ABD3TQH2_9LAMI